MRTNSHVVANCTLPGVVEQPDDLTALAGRPSSERADTRRTRERLVDAVQACVESLGMPPSRLADVAAEAGVSTATAYRHFASVDDAIQAFVLRLPVRAVELFEASGDADVSGDAVDALGRWNEAWVKACLEQGELALSLRSPVGFLQRREEGDPVIGFACAQIEPLLERLDGDVTMMLFTWNVVSDPREVLDLARLGWSAARIAGFVTRLILATPGPSTNGDV